MASYFRRDSFFSSPMLSSANSLGSLFFPLKQNLLLLLDLSWWPLTNLWLSVNFIMERNSSLLIKLRGGLQEGRKGWQVYSGDYNPNHRAPNHHFNSATSHFFIFHSELALLERPDVHGWVHVGFREDMDYIPTIWLLKDLLLPDHMVNVHLATGIRCK